MNPSQFLDSSNKALFIIPGNPPAVHFYELWKKDLEKEYSHIQVSAYPKHLKPTQSNYLQLVADNHTQQFLDFSATTHAPPSIAGHSLGAWMAMFILERHYQHIETCFLLHPFLRSPTKKGRLLLECLHYLQQAPYCKDWLLSTKPFFQRWIRHLPEVTSEELQVALDLAHHERNTIAQDRSGLNWSEQPWTHKIQAITTQKDTWCSPSVVQGLKKHVHHQECNLSHGFVVLPAERKSMAEYMVESKPL